MSIGTRNKGERFQESRSDPPRILVTNDDGIGALGIQVLTRTLVAAGFDVRVVAPSTDCSGASASLGSMARREPLVSEARVMPGANGVEAIAVDAPPAACAMLAILGAFGDYRPDVVVSGINAGANTGRAVIFSGTIGAALTASQMGVRGIAVSLAEGTLGGAAAVASGANDEGASSLLEEHYVTAAELAADLIAPVLAESAVRTYNLNVPSLSHAELKGVIEAVPAAIGLGRMAVEVGDDGTIETRYVRTGQELPAHTDTARIAAGWATLTVLGRPEIFDGEHVVAAMLEQRARDRSA